MSNARIGPAFVSIVLARNTTGVALFELEPAWTTDLVPRFRDYLRDSGFDAAFPGYLPVIHRRLRGDDIPHLDVILDEGFVFQDHIGVAPDGGWCRALQSLLTPVPEEPAEPAPPPPPRPLPRPRPGRMAAGLALAGLAATLVLPVGWTGRVPAPDTLPIPAEAAEIWLPLGLAKTVEAPVLLAALPEPEEERAVTLASLLVSVPGLDEAAPSPEAEHPQPAPPPLVAALPVPPPAPEPMPEPLIAALTSPPAPLPEAAPPAAILAELAPPPAPMPVAAPPAAILAEVVPDPRPADPMLTAMLLRRGHALLALGDISGARRFLERAGAEGSAEAARVLAETYDPRTLATHRTSGLQPDPLAALAWYRRAAALGAAVGPQIAALEAGR